MYNSLSFRPLIWLGLASCLVLIVVGATATSGGMAEFSPQTLEYRVRREWRIGCGALRVYVSRPQTVENEVLEFIQDEGYVQPLEGTEPRWIQVFHWNHAWHSTSQMSRVLNRDSTIYHCQEDPERAKHFWSKAFQLLRSRDPAEQMAGSILVCCCNCLETRAEIDEQIEHTLQFSRTRFPGSNR